jgi:predicted acylesterase/phospholipase RssA
MSLKHHSVCEFVQRCGSKRAQASVHTYHHQCTAYSLTEYVCTYVRVYVFLQNNNDYKPLTRRLRCAHLPGWVLIIPRITLALITFGLHFFKAAAALENFKRFRTTTTRWAKTLTEYEIGLALSGGCTAGAYEAGVVDFLYEALREWEAGRLSNPSSSSSSSSVPGWSVRLRAIAGASAGGLTTALATAALNSKCERVVPKHLPPHAGTSKSPDNLLYDGWVAKFDYKPMFKTDDLEPAGGIGSTGETTTTAVVKSFLYSRTMDDYAKSVLNDPIRTTSEPIPRWARQLQLYIATTNLRGVQYAVDGISANVTNTEYKMLEHIDVFAFEACSTTQPATQNGHNFSALNLNAHRDSDEAWNTLRNASVASSAFPCVFSPVTLSRGLSQVRNPLVTLQPTWPSGMSETYEYDAVDGAVFMVDPVEIVNQALQRSSTRDDSAPLPKKFSLADSSVIIVDPFPKTVDRVDNTYSAGKLSVWSALAGLFGAMQDESRFQFDTLMAAVDANDASKFMIAPFKTDIPSGQSPLSTGALGGFAGVLHHDIRAHDFHLGRQNCQQFLKSTFTILVEDAVKNPVFGEEALKYANAQGVIPIIPLFGTAQEECPTPQWPKFALDEKQRLQGDVLDKTRFRLHAIITTFAYNFGVLKKPSIWYFTWNATIGKVVDIITDKLVSHAERYLLDAMKVF